MPVPAGQLTETARGNLRLTCFRHPLALLVPFPAAALVLAGFFAGGDTDRLRWGGHPDRLEAGYDEKSPVHILDIMGR